MERSIFNLKTGQKNTIYEIFTIFTFPFKYHFSPRNSKIAREILTKSFWWKVFESFRDQTYSAISVSKSRRERFQDVLQKPPKGIGDTRARARERGKTRRRVCRHARPASLVSRAGRTLLITHLAFYVVSCKLASAHAPTDDDRDGNSTWERGALSVFTPTTSSPTVFMASRRGANGGTLPPGGLRLARIVVVVVFFFLLLRSTGDVYILMPLTG